MLQHYCMEYFKTNFWHLFVKNTMNNFILDSERSEEVKRKHEANRERKVLKLNGYEVGDERLMVKRFRYLGSVLQKDGGFKEDMKVKMDEVKRYIDLKIELSESARLTCWLAQNS